MVSTLKYDASEIFLHKAKWQTVMNAGVNHFNFEKFLEAKWVFLGHWAGAMVIHMAWSLVTLVH